MKRDTLLKRYKGNWNSIPGTEPDIMIDFGTSLHPHENQMLEIGSWHGQKKKTEKRVSLSLQEIIELRNLLNNVIDNAPELIKTRFDVVKY